MNRSRALLAALPVLLTLCAPAAAQAAPVTDESGASKARVLRPAWIRNLQDLDFAYLSVTTGGTAIVDPVTDTMTTTGGVVQVGGIPHSALFEGISPSKGVVIIRLPKQPITVTRVGGTETMTVKDWTIHGTDRNGRRTITSQEPFDFKVGGTLVVNANQAEGAYVGSFDVEIQYP